MPKIDLMGIENETQGICGFTSTLYAVYTNSPILRGKLEGALDDTMRSTRLMAEIKTVLMMMKAANNNTVLDQITELTRTFPNYGGWTVDSYIQKINDLTVGDYSIAMPPDATMEYMRTAWDMHPRMAGNVESGHAILGLTRTGAPLNRWKNLAHYVYQNANGRLYSWGAQFKDLAELNQKRKRDYSVIYRIMVQ